MRYTFTTEERAEMQSAVRSLEVNTGGELVTYFVRSSNDYMEASWKISALAGVLGSILVFFSPSSGVGMSFALALVVIGFILPLLFPAIKRLAISDAKMRGVVLGRAKDAFFDEKVGHTKNRIGILLFISRLERQVVVLGDKEISNKVDYADWYQVVGLVSEGIQNKKIGEGIARAIQQCERLLLEHGFKGNGDAEGNELSDELREIK